MAAATAEVAVAVVVLAVATAVAAIAAGEASISAAAGITAAVTFTAGLRISALSQPTVRSLRADHSRRRALISQAAAGR